ncbi:Ig-like domain-containing protein [Flavobacterium branchiophilum]|uniref:Uncharacterized protein n=1 Tax=Flavobacterium branchiophilum TaxID=55197 RepID=A0A2H3KDF4_9FLAO|nr:T9SS type A sorting domain-containing protein [Flavobacterium branchiophilum]PDS24608.1 hypothetical protein B0A77_07440 [Flavobacterium branchiophilum]
MKNNYDSVVSRIDTGPTHVSNQKNPPPPSVQRTWLSFVMLFVAFFTFVFVQGQSIGNYAFETATTGTLQELSSGSTSYLAGNQDDASGTVQEIGFNFIFMGVSYTHFSANSNGQMQLHTSSTATAIGTNVSTAAGSAILAPFTGDNEVNNGLRFKVIGTAPNRTFILEWNQFYVSYYNLSNAGNMQVWLEEITGKITYIYGDIYNSSTTTSPRSISIASSNTATTVGSVTIGATATFTAGTTLVSNTIAAGANPVGATPIANIGSTADGSRRYFSFTPISTVLGDVNTITFSGITANLTTVNWVDNATNEFGFMVTRATDAGFTQNVSSVFVTSTTSAGSGTSYLSNQTGLSAGTNYFYKVVALVVAGQSTGITGSQTTLNGATYYWVGTSTLAAPAPFATLANWNTSADGSGSTPTSLTNSDTYIVDGDGSTTTGGNVFISVAAAATVGQLKVINNTTLSFESTTTATRTITISGGPGDDFVVENGSSFSLLNATKAAAIAFSGSGNTGLIAGTINFAGSTSNVITTTGGTGTAVNVASTGVVNLGVAGNTLVGSVATLSFATGSNCNSTGATTGAPPVPLATWDTTATLTISGLTTSTTAPTNNNQSFGNVVFNCPLLTTTLNFFGANTSTIKGNLTITAAGSTGSTGIFRATSTGTLTVNGNILISQGRFQATTTTGTVIANGNTTIEANGILDLSTTGAGGLSQRGTTLTNNGVLTGTSGTLNFVNLTGSAAQTLAGSGTVLTNIATLNMQNTAGLTITHTNPIIVARVNLFQGTITNSNKITFGIGAAVNCTTQIGSAGLTTAGGSFDAAPTFNLGTGTYSLIYAQESIARTSGYEIPATRTANSVTVSNTNGVTLAGGNLTALTALTLTNGIVTTGTNILQLGDATTVGTLTGGSDTAYVNGALTRSIANANTNATFIPFPIGKSGVYTPIALAPSTTSIALFKAESFSSNTGTEDPSIIGLSTTRRFEALPVLGTFTDIKVRLSDSGIVSTNIPVQSPSATGAYSSAFGSTAAFVAGPPITLTSNFSATSANYTGYLSYANSNTCSGTPAPGNTIPSTNAICLGQSVNLSLQAIPAGTGITYQWKSSTDGTTYTAITGATNATLTVTPTLPLYYKCEVTCSTGPATGSSTAVQITFANSITATTPATRCGIGTVSLAATANSGATVKWYAAETGGVALGSGATFTTPNIAATTTYYAGAESSTPVSATIGNGTTLTGATAQPSAFVNRWPSYRIQTLYTAAELNAAGLGAGNITSMAYFTTTLGDGATNSNFTVKIGTSTQTSMTTTWVPTTSFATVYGPVTHTHTASGEQPINFTTPFNWDGVSNIVIEVMYNGADITNNGITYFTATTGNMVVHSDFNGSSATTGTVTTTRLNLKLNGQATCSSGRMPAVATVTTPPTLTLNTNSTTICSGSTSSAITISTGASDYDTYNWTPATGVTGNSTTGWTFNPTISTVYTLNASQSTGTTPCNNIVTFPVTVNAVPADIAITPASASICVDAIQKLEATPIDTTVTRTVGTATTISGNASLPTAFCNRFDHYWGQMLFTAAELNALGINAGNITALKFNITTQGSATNVTDFKLRIGTTTNTTLSAFVTTGLTTVFSTATYNHVVGENTITFQTPYTWDGTSNIVVDIRQTGIDSSNNATTYYTATTGNTVLYAVTSTAVASSDAYAESNPTPITSVNRLNTTFVATNALPSTITWSPATNLYTDATATTPYTTGTVASSVYVKSTSAVTTTYTATATANNSCTKTKTVEVVVKPNTTLTLTSATGTDAQTVCINTAFSDITYNITTATGASVTGLPDGVTGTYTSGVFTISGTPTASGTFNYTITPSGGCGTATATGSIVVKPNTTLTLTSATGTNAQNFCLNLTLIDITYDITTATGATVTGLPDGVTGSYANGVFTISGFPTASGTFNYTITPTGGCGTATATGSIVVKPISTLTLTSATGTEAQTLCINSAITDIQYTVGNATGASITGLPTGVTGTYSNGVFTISGTPTESGTFDYTLTPSNGCGTVAALGSIVVKPNTTLTLTSATGTNAQNFCLNLTLIDITYDITTATGATVTGLPDGVTGSYANGVFTISGFPTASGTFNYTITPTGGCGTATATGSIVVKPISTLTLTSATGTEAQTLCINSAITDIQYTVGNANGASITGLPTGVTGAYANGVFTISGTPTESGTFDYTLTPSNGCGTVAALGSIVVKPNTTLTLTSATGTNAQNICLTNAIVDIKYNVVSASGATVTGLPAGVNATFANNVVTISGTPTATGTFNYTITPSGACGTATATGSIVINNCQVEWANLQAPGTASINVGQSVTVTGQVYKTGVTPGTGQGANISAWIGYSTTNTDPSTWTNWVAATYNSAYTGFSNDEYKATIGASLPAGTYYIASRFQSVTAPYVYGGYSTTGGGFWDGSTFVNGVLTISCNVATPTGSTTQTFVEGHTVADIMVTTLSGATVNWYASAADAAAGTNAIPTTTVLANNTTYYVTQTVGSCTSTALAVTITVTLKNDSFDSKAFTYYPNPTFDVLHLNYSNAITKVKVTNMIGQEVISIYPNATTAQLDLSGYAAGTYFVEVTADTVSKTVKVIKK